MRTRCFDDVGHCGITPPVLSNRENRSKLIFMIEAKFSPADAADLRPGQPVDVELK